MSCVKSECLSDRDPLIMIFQLVFMDVTTELLDIFWYLKIHLAINPFLGTYQLDSLTKLPSEQKEIDYLSYQNKFQKKISKKQLTKLITLVII